MRTSKFFYFDLGNVLLEFSHERSAQQLAEVAGCTYQVAWEALFGPAKLEEKWETGLVDNAGFHRKFSELTGTTSDPIALVYAASDIFTPLWGTLPIVAQLYAAGYPLGILSNTCEGHWNYCLRRFRFIQSFFAPRFCLSYVEQSMKPNEKIYRQACNAVGLSPKDVFFVDDREDNVAAACRVGIDAVLFTTPQQLYRDLYSRRVDGF